MSFTVNKALHIDKDYFIAERWFGGSCKLGKVILQFNSLPFYCVRVTDFGIHLHLLYLGVQLLFLITLRKPRSCLNKLQVHPSIQSKTWSPYSYVKLNSNFYPSHLNLPQPIYFMGLTIQLGDSLNFHYLRNALSDLASIRLFIYL